MLICLYFDRTTSHLYTNSKIHFLCNFSKFFQFCHIVFTTVTSAVYVFVTYEDWDAFVSCDLTNSSNCSSNSVALQIVWLFVKFLSCFCNRPFQVIPQLSASVLQYVRLQHFSLILFSMFHSVLVSLG